MKKIFKVPQYELTEKDNSNFISNFKKYLVEYFSLCFVSIASIFFYQGIQIQGIQIVPDYSYVIVGAIFIGGAAFLNLYFHKKAVM